MIPFAVVAILTLAPAMVTHAKDGFLTKIKSRIVGTNKPKDDPVDPYDLTDQFEKLKELNSFGHSVLRGETHVQFMVAEQKARNSKRPARLDHPVRELSFFNVPDEVWPLAARLTSVEELTVYAGDLRGDRMRSLAGLKHLTRFRIVNTKFGTSELALLKQFPQLETIEVDLSTQFEDSDDVQAANLGELSQAEKDWLKELDKYFAAIREPFPRRIANSVLLTDRALRQLVDLKELRTVKLTNTYYSSRSLAVFGRFPKLEELQPAPLDQTPVAGRQLGAMASLRRISGVHYSAEFLRELGKQTQLEEIGCGLTDESANQLAKIVTLKKIGSLSLDDLTDVGLRSLADLPKLESLSIPYCTKLTPRGVQAFRDHCPDCKLQIDEQKIQASAKASLE